MTNLRRSRKGGNNNSVNNKSSRSRRHVGLHHASLTGIFVRVVVLSGTFISLGLNAWHHLAFDERGWEMWHRTLDDVAPYHPTLRGNDAAGSRLPRHRTESDVVYFVLSRRDAFETRRAIRDTWAMGHDNVYFVVGDKACRIPPTHRKKGTFCEAGVPRPPSVGETRRHMSFVRREDDAIRREQEEHGDMLVTDNIDTYRLLPKKLKASYDFVSHHLPNVRWVVKTDDDFFVRVDTFADYLRNTYDSSGAMVIGGIFRNHTAQTEGKWREVPEWPRGKTYPPFPLGSKGHVVSRPVAEYVADHRAELFEYQGEDVSLGIWLDQSPLNVTFVTSGRMTNNKRCRSPRYWVIGHDITATQMRICHKKADEITVPTPLVQKLELVHITKTGGSAIERAGAEAGIFWGACHFLKSDELNCHSPDRVLGLSPIRDVKGLQIHEEVIEWHLPTKYFKTSPYGDASTFTVVRNPYDRVVSEYYCRWNGFGSAQTKERPDGTSVNRNNPATMNKWIQHKLGIMMSKQKFLLKSGHFYPQYHYVYHDNGTLAVNHILRYESLQDDFQKLMSMYNLEVTLPNHAINPALEKSDEKLTSENLSPETIYIVNKYFSRDFELFGYQLRSPESARPRIKNKANKNRNHESFRPNPSSTHRKLNHTPLTLLRPSAARDDLPLSKDPNKPFNSFNPHMAWCPNAACSNSPMCQPCRKRFIILVATARSGSTSLMRMLNLLPGVRISGENNNQLFAIHEMIDNIASHPTFTLAETQSAWGHGHISPGDFACPAQRMMEALNPPPKSIQDLTTKGFNDTSTIIGFKTIRFLEGWNGNDGDAVSFLRDHFPCSRVVINVHSDTARQSTSQKKHLVKGRAQNSDALEAMNKRLQNVASLLGANQSFFLDSNEWFEAGGHAEINKLVRWLGFENCVFSSILHDNARGYQMDQREIRLGVDCRFVAEN